MNISMKIQSKKNGLFASLVICVAIRALVFYVLNILEGSNYEYIEKIISINSIMEEENIPNLEKSKLNNNEYKNWEQNRINYLNGNLEQYFQTNKRYNKNIKQCIFKSDSMYYSFNSDIYNMKYIYDSYILSKRYKDIYSFLVLRINPIFLSFLHFIIFNEKKNIMKKVRIKTSEKKINGQSNMIDIFPYHEFRYFMLICLTDIFIAIFLFLIIEHIKKKKHFFNYIYEQTSQNGWKLINPILLINVYLNNPLTVLANVFLSLDNFKLLIITMSFYLTILRISTNSNKIILFINFFCIIVLNSILIYITSFHFILIIIGINNFIISIKESIITSHIKKHIEFQKLFFVLFKNFIILLFTCVFYGLLIIVSYYMNGKSISFLNNTLINEYKIFYLIPNLGNYWYIFSTMFKNYYYSFLFLFHFHIFLYPIPLFFRLSKTPLIYLKIMIAIALVFHPNIVVNDIIYVLVLISIDYENTLYTIPFAKLLSIWIIHFNMFSITLNIWLRKNTGNANFVLFNQLIVFNATAFIIINSIKFYIRIQTPTTQLEEGKCIVVSKSRNTEFKLLNIFKKKIE
ncbi:GPI transamidase subunit PIG-U, putative [Plasmodium berghei]|uniref:GPI transamidase subunit PIG-U, putative n=2 Tax=Plasmodium berghei TaxID=5821 RepID=A0A509AT35_PLABA|nr:GPI transamidase subunit PIG-U, putative [Plasmodium berghei ANKA]CXJ00297.1 GPI transamidase subunit PIG-U, putative [Plasmodium berghei]SCL97994.1 GPI transamidase subunit PIG-U, putative [Plasmodium berghei]SCM16730.1 GPI transamidase subunit PIG-U, putative [Plasmodium berghei]SCM18528.1 GPI transamidase subunit PIG-U, putative [Plasmodium berghei]SCN27961.1 GPI transamidase subunit PIG-U, putative [Plasmodium berghei]|eukprot:XP_034423614.1 GPI transamidase subunit PIG-U, putative [Plasmodium berghei ANKA]